MPTHIRPQATVDTGLLLSDAGVLDWQIAQICGVAVKTVRRWRRLYQRRGLARGGTAPMPPCFICDDGPLDAGAYSYLLGLYLGDGHIALNKRKLYVLSIFQDNRYPGLIEECREVIKALKPGARPHLSPKNGCTAVQAYSKHWACLFPQHGSGLKSKRPIVLEPWQRDIVELDPKPFLRGLIFSDGCRITNWTVRPVGGEPKRYEYPRYFFSTGPRTSWVCAHGHLTCSPSPGGARTCGISPSHDARRWPHLTSSWDRSTDRTGLDR